MRISSPPAIGGAESAARSVCPSDDMSRRNASRCATACADGGGPSSLKSAKSDATRSAANFVRLAVVLDLRPCDDGIVLEDQRPAFVDGAFEDATLCLQRDERLDVVTHDPRQRQVRHRRRQVRDVEAQCAVATVDEQTLMMWRVARRLHRMNSRDDLAVTVDELHLAGGAQRLEVVRKVARGRTLVRVRRPLVLAE